jgi:hypothetical protein
MSAPEKSFYFIVLFFVAFVICDYSDEVDMSLFRFSTKNPYFFKPIGEKNYFNAEHFVPRKIWGIYR